MGDLGSLPDYGATVRIETRVAFLLRLPVSGWSEGCCEHPPLDISSVTLSTPPPLRVREHLSSVCAALEDGTLTRKIIAKRAIIVSISLSDSVTATRLLRHQSLRT